jgi:hypothetical protein
MRGEPRDVLPSFEIRSRISNNRVLSAIRSDQFRILSVLGAVALLMTISVAGILSGLGLFLLAMLAAKTVAVVASSLLLSFSVATFLVCYLWLTS